MAAILAIHASPAQLGILAALARGPGIVVGLFAGGFVDRTSRRRVMIASDLARVALILTVPVAAWWGVLGMMQLYVVAGLAGAAGVLFDIADHAFLPSLIDRADLVDGNAKLSVTDSTAEIAGPAMAGVLFQLLTAPFAMLVTAVTYFVSACFLFAIPATETRPPKSRTPWWRDAGEGLRAILSEPLMRPTLWLTLTSTFFGAFFWPLYLMYGLKVIGLSPSLMGVNIAMGGVGALCASALSTLLCRRFGVGRAVLTGYFGYSAALLLVPLAQGPLWLATSMLMVAQFFGDAFAVAFLIPLTSLRQAVLPPGLLGRTQGLFGAVAGAMTVLGALTGGFLGGWLGPRETLAMAVAGQGACGLFLVFSPVRRLRDIPLKSTDREPK